MTSVKEFSEYNILGSKKRIWNVPNFIHKNRLTDLNYQQRYKELVNSTQRIMEN